MAEVWLFEIQIYQTTSDGETTNIKVVDLDQNNNFVVDDFFYLKSFRVLNIHFKILSSWYKRNIHAI
jgi:hypothetical protein